MHVSVSVSLSFSVCMCVHVRMGADVCTLVCGATGQPQVSVLGAGHHLSIKFSHFSGPGQIA